MAADTKKRGLGLSSKLTIATAGVLVVSISVNYLVFVIGFRDSAETSMVEQAAAFTALADEAKNHAAKLMTDDMYDTEVLLEEVRETIASHGDYKDTRFFNAIPVVVGWTTAGEAAARENIDFRVPAFNARNPQNLPEAGSFREELLRDLYAQAGSGGGDALHRINKSTNSLHYMRAIRLDQSCMMCHGDPAIYDDNGDGKDILGFPMESWAIGDQHGAYEVIVPLEKTDTAVAGFIGRGLMFTVPVVLLAGGGLILLLRSLLAKPLNDLVSIMQDIATGDGDLTKRTGINRSDEIGFLSHWIDQFMAGLHKLIGDVAGAADQVSAAAVEIAASSEQMSSGINQQESQTDQVSAAIEQMAASVREVSSKSGEAADAAKQSGESARQGGEVVQQTIDEMLAIADEVNQSARTVSTLGEKGQQIGEIIGVINDIADQTNLLALNAAIEAARAGEHGRGFAVVADEVRKLAERTTQATEQVSGSIREIQSETDVAVKQIESGTSRVASGVELARSAGQALEQILAGSDVLGNRVQQIAAATEQQTTASDSVARSMERIQSVTRETAQGAGQASDAAMSLSREAETLKSLVGRFRL